MTASSIASAGHADGQYRWHLGQGLPQRDAAGRILRWFGTCTDIHDRKQAEQGLKTAQDQLEIRVQERTSELSQAMEAFRTERQRFRDVLDRLPSYVVLLTPDYHVAFANRVFRERFGEANGRRCFEALFGRSEPCEVCETYKVLQTRASHQWEWTGPDGRSYNVFDFPFTDADGSTLILEMGMDETQRKLAEAQLTQYRDHLEELVAQRTNQLQAGKPHLKAEIAERKQAEQALARSPGKT